MRLIAIGLMLALGGCNSDGLVRRSEAESIAEDFADAAASGQAARIDELEARVQDLEAELDGNKAAVSAVAKVVDGNAEISNKNILAAATARGECGTQVQNLPTGGIITRPIPCTAENYFKRE